MKLHSDYLCALKQKYESFNSKRPKFEFDW